MSDTQSDESAGSSSKSLFRRLINTLLLSVGIIMACVLFFWALFACAVWLFMAFFSKPPEVEQSADPVPSIEERIEFTRNAAIMNAVLTNPTLNDYLQAAPEPVIKAMSNPPATAEDLKGIAKGNKCAQRILRDGRQKFLEKTKRLQDEEGQLWMRNDMADIGSYCIASDLVDAQRDVIKSITDAGNGL